jgi:hypothetical protein
MSHYPLSAESAATTTRRISTGRRRLRRRTAAGLAQVAVGVINQPGRVYMHTRDVYL